MRGEAQHQNNLRGLRHGARPHALVSALVRAGHGLRTTELNTVLGLSFPSKQTRRLLCKLRDQGYTRLDGDHWHATPEGQAAVNKGSNEDSADGYVGQVAPPPRPIQAAPRRELPLVLRPGAEDYRQYPSRRGQTLVWDHQDGRQERMP